MFDTLSEFVNSVSAFEINIPLWLQIAIIVIVIVVLCVGGYFMRDFFNISYMKSGMSWFIIVAVLNLATILIIFIYYSKKSTTTVGPQGVKGKKGKMGKKGKSISCAYCKNNIYIQSTRKNDVICKLSIFTTDFKSISDNAEFFQNIIDNGNNIAYDSFVNGIILGKTIETKNTEAVAKFRTLMTPTSIIYQLVQVINDTITKASNTTYGTFRNPNGKVGYMALGDSVYGGLENFNLNSFMVSGDIMYPSTYNKLITFTSYNSDNQDTDTYTIWRPVGQSITDNSGFKNSKETNNYMPLGDICRSGTATPKLSDVATIKESCLEPVKSKELILVFLYIGALTFSDETSNLDYTQTDTYLIQNKTPNDIQMFSVWRTPLNTFITNCNVNDNNKLENKSFVFNMYNNTYDALNEYGNISTEYKNKASNLLQSLQIPKILVSAIICKHYEIELRKEIVYYFNKYQSQVPEFASINALTATFGDLMSAIENTNKEYETYNQDLVKKSSIAIQIKKKNGEIKNKYTTYDSTKERHLPPKLLMIYSTVNDKLLTISVEIENANNLLDIVNIIFDNGIESRIAIDSDGIAEGGLLLNEIQESIIMISKMLLPPTQTTYIIKDECLGTFPLDKDRESIIKDLTVKMTDFNNFTDDFATDSQKYSSVMQNIRQYETLMDSQIGQLCGHIEEYQSKINDMNLEEFTTSRLKQLVKIYEQMNLYFTDIKSKV